MIWGLHRVPLGISRRAVLPAVCWLPLLLSAAPAQGQTLPPGPEEEHAVVGPPSETERSSAPQTASTPEKTEQGPVHSPWLLGVHVGYSLWSDKGLPENSTSVGGRFGYRYTPGMELEVRGRYIKSGSTGVSAASGWAVSAANVWFVNLSANWELGLGAGAGYEGHKTKLRTTRAFLHGRVAPLLRWYISSSFAMDLGPELGVGLMSSEGTAGADQSNQFVFRYGGFANFSWRWGSGDSSREDSGSGSDDGW